MRKKTTNLYACHHKIHINSKLRNLKNFDLTILSKYLCLSTEFLNYFCSNYNWHTEPLAIGKQDGGDGSPVRRSRWNNWGNL